MTFCGNAPPASVAQPRRPLRERRARGRVQARDRRRVELARERERREPRAVQDLVRVRVADAVEQARIGERALHRVVLRREARRERREVRALHVEAAHVERAQRERALHAMQRRAALGAGFGERERPVREVEQRERDAAGRLAARLQPHEAAGDHQVQHEEQVVVEREDEALAEPANRAHGLAVHDLERRHRGAQQERVAQFDPREHLPDDTRLERFAVDLDVGQFGHFSTAGPRRRPGAAGVGVASS